MENVLLKLLVQALNIVKFMDLQILILSVNFVVQLHFGFALVLLTSAIHVIEFKIIKWKNAKVWVNAI